MKEVMVVVICGIVVLNGDFVFVFFLGNIVWFGFVGVRDEGVLMS